MSDKPIPVHTGTVIDDIRRIARDHGYAVAVHGSLRPERDIDLIAAPWTKDAHGPWTLVRAINRQLGYLWRVKQHDQDPPKPHGRLGFVWLINGHRAAGCPRYVDLSVMPRNASVSAGLDWAGLAACAATPFPHGWDPDEYVFFSPRDPGVHSAILQVVQSAGHSILANHYGFDDDEISAAMLGKAADGNIAFLLNLDSSQAGGVHERKLLEAWRSYVGTSVAVGRSLRKAISHLKVTVVDGIYVVSGSTNLSLSGETLQDNECRITRNAMLAARYSAVIMLNHAEMKKQMDAKAA